MFIGVYFRRAAAFCLGRQLMFGLMAATVSIAAHATSRQEFLELQYVSLEAAAHEVLTQNPQLASHVRLERMSVKTNSAMRTDYYTVDGQHFGICMLRIWAPGDDSLWGVYLPQVTDHAMQQLALRAFVAHELTHCEQYLSAYDDLENSAAVAPAYRSQVHDLAALSNIAASHPEQTVWSESLADLGALLYVQEYYPQSYEAFRKILITYRLYSDSTDKQHRTSKVVLDRSVSRLQDESRFAAAIRIRNELYHVPADVSGPPDTLASN